MQDFPWLAWLALWFGWAVFGFFFLDADLTPIQQAGALAGIGLWCVAVAAAFGVAMKPPGPQSPTPDAPGQAFIEMAMYGFRDVYGDAPVLLVIFGGIISGWWAGRQSEN